MAGAVDGCCAEVGVARSDLDDRRIAARNADRWGSGGGGNDINVIKPGKRAVWLILVQRARRYLCEANGCGPQPFRPPPLWRSDVIGGGVQRPYCTRDRLPPATLARGIIP